MEFTLKTLLFFKFLKTQILIQIFIKVYIFFSLIFKSKIYIEKLFDCFVPNGILPSYKSKDFEIVNKLNKNSFHYDSSDFFEFQNKKNTLTFTHSTMPVDNHFTSENNFGVGLYFLENKKKFFDKIACFYKKKIFDMLKYFIKSSCEKKHYAFSLENSSTKETNSLGGFEKENKMMKEFKVKLLFQMMKNYFKSDELRKKCYYLNKWKCFNKLAICEQKFTLKLKEQEKKHEEVCKKYQELMVFERENFVKLNQIQIINQQNNQVPILKQEMKENPCSKSDILRVFDAYYERLLSNLTDSQKNQNHDKNKLILYDLFLDVIDEFLQ